MWKWEGYLKFWRRVVFPHCLMVHPVETLAFSGVHAGQLEEVGHPAGRAGLGHLQLLDQIPLWKVNLAPGDPVLLGPVKMPTHEACVATIGIPISLLNQVFLSHTTNCFPNFSNLCPICLSSSITNVEVVFHLN